MSEKNSPKSDREKKFIDGLLHKIDMNSKDSLRRWILRAISLMISISLWLFVSWNMKTETADSNTAVRTVPLRFVNVPEGSVVNCAIADVKVSLSGRNEDLARLDRDSITATISLADVRPGKYHIPVEIGKPESVTVAGIEPARVDLELYRIIERTLKPYVIIDDDDEDKITVNDISFTPEEIVVKGAESSVMNVRTAGVEISVADIATATEALDLPIVLLDANENKIEDLEITPPTVLLIASVTEQLSELVVPINAPIRGRPAEGWMIGRVELEPKSATLRGTSTALANITELTLDPIDITSHDRSMVIDIPLDPPSSGITLAGASSVRISIEIFSPTEKKDYAGIPISIVGARAGDHWVARPSHVNVVVEREIDKIASNDATPVDVIVDVSNIISESVVLPILVRPKSPGVRVISSDPKQAMAIRVLEVSADERSR